MLTHAQSSYATRVRQVLTDKDRAWLTSEEAASIAGITRVGLLRWYDRHPGLAHKVGSRWRIDPAVLVSVLSGAPLPKQEDQHGNVEDNRRDG